MAQTERLLTIDDVANLWSVKENWLYDEVEGGRLPAVRLGRQLRFRHSDLDAYLSSRVTADGSSARARPPHDPGTRTVE